MTKALYFLAAVVLVGVGFAPAARAPRTSIQVVYQPQENGDYRLYLFGSNRTLVCEEKAIRIVEQGDAVSPVVLECRH